MTDKEKIIAYIDKLLEKYPKNYYLLTVAEFIDSLQEEPVSEDLKTELNKYIKDHFTIDKEQLDRFGIEEKDYMYSMDKSDMLALVEHFTNWQKTQDQSTIELAEDHAMLAGMEKMKEEMMAKAIDGDITFDYYGDDDKTYGCIAHDSFCLEDFGLKDRNKVKMILIKEE